MPTMDTDDEANRSATLPDRYASVQIFPAQAEARRAVLLNIPIPPSVNRRFEPGKPSRRGGRVGRLRLTSEVKSWAKTAGQEVMIQRQKLVRGPVRVTVMVERMATRGDIDNLLKALLDLLETQAIIENDRLVERLEVRWTNCCDLVSVCVEAMTDAEVNNSRNATLFLENAA